MENWKAPHLNPHHTDTCPSSRFNPAQKTLTAIALGLKALLSCVWDIVFTSSSELRIWQKRDRLGQIYWQVYDPRTDRFIRFNSEQEVRRWLERQFYNH